LWVKYLTFANFSKTYDNVNILLWLLPGLWKGPMRIRGLNAQVSLALR
jgi:hypothetical protein